MNDIRIPLNDKSIAQLATPKEGWYLASDTELKGFFVVVGKRKRTFTVQDDLPYIANGCMRALRAIYNHARKTTDHSRATIQRTLSIGMRRSTGILALAADDESSAAEAESRVGGNGTDGDLETRPSTDDHERTGRCDDLVFQRQSIPVSFSSPAPFKADFGPHLAFSA
jgi:hypothetical protein